jgi:hypothetical protein
MGNMVSERKIYALTDEDVVFTEYSDVVRKVRERDFLNLK